MQEYIEQKFELGELAGLSAKQVEVHLGLYSGYVKNANKLNATFLDLSQDAEQNAYAISEVKRRFGFEFNGMRLHEYYFEQFENKVGVADPAFPLQQAIAKQWGSYEAWEVEFKTVGKIRGIGWALLLHDEKADRLINVWVSDHEIGHLAGQKILLAMDIWEHAFMVDYLPSERGVYIDAFFKNLNWEVVEIRY